MTDRKPRTPPPRRRPSLKVRLLFLGFSLLLALVVAEVGLRLLAPRSPGNEPAPADRPVTTWDARYGWVLDPGVSLTLRSPEFQVEARISSQGLRADRDYPPTPPPGVFRVLAVGDSFTFGNGVEADQAFPALVEKQIPGSEVVNMGVPGYGTDQSLLLLRDRIDQIDPHVVLLGLFEGDVFRNARAWQLSYRKPRFVLRDGRLELTGVPVPRVDPGHDGPPRALWQRSRVFDLLLGRGGELAEHLGYGEAWPVTEAIIRDMKELARAHGAELVVLLIPKDNAIYGKAWRRDIHLKAMAAMRRICAGAGVSWIDPLEDLERAHAATPGERLYFVSDGHLTPLGHRTVAEAVARSLRRMDKP